MSSMTSEFIRGRESESKTLSVLRELKAEQLISNYRKTDRLSKDDLCGIDFYFSILIKGRRIEIPLQVKSSWGGVRSHQEKENRRDIYAVNAQAPDLRNQIVSIIKDYKSAFESEEPMAVVKEKVQEKKETVVLANADQRVHSSFEYKRFKFVGENRELKPLNLKNLKQSIQRVDLSDYFPILVTKDLQIIDGQHRFTVWKELGMAIKYKIMKTPNLEIIADINTAQSSWNIGDLIKHHAALGNTNYQLLQDDMKKHKMTAKTLLLFIMSKNNYSDDIRRKTLIYRKEDSNKLNRFMNEVQIFKRHEFGKQSKFYQAFAALREHHRYEPSVMVHQEYKYGKDKLGPRTTTAGYLEDLVYLYNYTRAKNAAIDIRDFG